MTAQPVVGIAMGSATDLPTMAEAAAVLDELGVPYEQRVLSAHRTPFDLLEWGASAADRGLRVLIGGAGGAAHLPGMLAGVTALPVIGVPVATKDLGGMDSLLSVVQMPTGAPVATVGIGRARNAGILAARILALDDPALRARVEAQRQQLSAASREADADVAARPGRQP